MNRINRVIDILNDNNLDSLIIVDPSNRRYLTGFTGSNGILIISKNRNVLITDYRYEEQARIQASHVDIVLHNDHTGHKESKSTIYKVIIDQIKRLELNKVGFEQDVLSVGFYNLLYEHSNAEFIPTLDLVENLRMIKTRDEINKLKVAAEIADETFKYIIEFIRPGVTEHQVSDKIGHFIEKQGASNIGFLPIVASGYRSALAHGRASDKVIQKGEMVVIDFGANYQSYWSDITRTVAVGTPSDKMIYIYGIVKEALEKALLALKPGVYDQEIDHIIKQEIKLRGYEKYAGTGTGHGLGIDVHENPFLSTKKDKEIKKDMVMAIEPGIYIPGKGGVRIEDNVIVTENGYVNWISSTKDLIIL